MTGALVFAIGDIHGRPDLVRAALDAIAERAAGREHRLVFLGDYVDRGPDARGVVELMLELQTDPGVVCLKGNHEALMVQAMTGGRESDFRRWVEVGGQTTLESYGATDLESALTTIPDQHLRWMAALPLTSGDGNRVYVHAGLLPDLPLDRQTEETCLWIRERFLRAGPRHFDTHVVHGHTPAWNDEAKTCEPELLPHRTNLDLASYLTNKLGVGVFDCNLAGGPVEVLIAHGAFGEAINVVPLTAAHSDVRESGSASKPGRNWTSVWRALRPSNRIRRG